MFVLRITKIRPFKQGYWRLFLKGFFFFVITGLVKGDDVFNDNDKKKNKNEVDNNINSDNNNDSNNDNDITY